MTKPRYRFDREAGGLVEIARPIPADGESMTEFMSRINREQREAEAREPFLDLQGRNPWSKEHWNATHQMLVMNRNPALAAELRRQSGVA